LSESQESNPTNNKWSHRDKYEQKCFQKIIEAYDEIMRLAEDISEIANLYQLTVEEVRRAKNYAFGSGVSHHKFVPDEEMALAWKRLGLGQGNAIDEVLLRHEIFESDLVINRGMNQKDAREMAQARYPWSELLKQQWRTNE
jgi:hypothetical protein